MFRATFTLAVCLTAATAWSQSAASQTAAPQSAAPAASAATTKTPPAPPAAVPASVPLPTGYVIGPEDVLSVLVWREADMSSQEVIVRPDGMITLPLINEMRAAGLTPEELRQQVTTAATRFVEEPGVTVVVKAIHSRKIYITGQVSKPGPYALLGPTTVMQLIALAGGVLEFADSENISILRREGGKDITFQFNYKDVAQRRKLAQNIELKPGDTIVVP